MFQCTAGKYTIHRSYGSCVWPRVWQLALSFCVLDDKQLVGVEHWPVNIWMLGMVQHVSKLWHVLYGMYIYIYIFTRIHCVWVYQLCYNQRHTMPTRAPFVLSTSSWTRNNFPKFWPAPPQKTNAWNLKPKWFPSSEFPLQMVANWFHFQVPNPFPGIRIWGTKICTDTVGRCSCQWVII